MCCCDSSGSYKEREALENYPLPYRNYPPYEFLQLLLLLFVFLFVLKVTLQKITCKSCLNPWFVNVVDGILIVAPYIGYI